MKLKKIFFRTNKLNSTKLGIKQPMRKWSEMFYSFLIYVSFTQTHLLIVTVSQVSDLNHGFLDYNMFIQMTFNSSKKNESKRNDSADMLV